MTCNIPNCERPAVINAAYAADGARCYEHSAIGQWIPCSVAMPPQGVTVIAHARGVRGPNRILASYDGPRSGWSAVYDHGIPSDDITHWTRIPGGP